MNSTELTTGSWSFDKLRGRNSSKGTVFSCFAGGGGSTMGYKLAGFQVLGCNEIDEKMINIYRQNHNPIYSFHEAIQIFKLKDGLPKPLYDLDILDGSPPCSSFSMAGNREKDWGKTKKFREGQADQVLDDLFFHFIDLAQKLRPKIVIAENVKGMLMGKAKGYVKEIFQRFNDAEYDCQLFLLNSSRMGVPQKRERIFFIGRRKDLKLSKLKLNFHESVIPLEKAFHGCRNDGKSLGGEYATLWRRCPKGKSLSVVHPKGFYFTSIKAHPKLPANTIIADPGSKILHWKEPRELSSHEIQRIQTFPDDYDFCGADPKYVMGMSIPPFMIKRLALEIHSQLLSL